MANPIGLVLGNIPFYQREVPDTINFGGKQMLALHRNIGGFRNIAAMGPDPDDIHWGGHLLTVPGVPGNAAQRARALDNLRKSGAQVWLYWGSFSYQVIVRDFTAVYKHEWEIAYKITVQVINDTAVDTPPPTLTDQVQADIAAIQAFANAVNAAPAVSGTATITSPMTAGLMAINNTISAATNNGVTPLENLSRVQLQPVLDAVNGAISAFGVGSGTPAGINLDAITGASTLDGINAFVAEVNNVAAESDVQIALGYLGRIAGNLQMATG